MNIGDLFLRVLADDKGFEADLVTKTGKAGDKAGTTLGQKLSGGFKKAGAGLVDGLKLGAGIAAFGALDTAISATIGFLSDAVAAAREDQASIAGLDNAIRQNVKSWDGNRDAIEKVITARMRLGFTDEEQRKSLALLVGATHNVNKALEIQRIAMDLAVRKHISLEEASTALIKVEGGQYRALKALGIILPKNATAEQALAAAQKVVAGAAETEANTENGKLKASQIALSERMEKLGYVIMPVVTEGALALADAVLAILDPIISVAEAVGPFIGQLQALKKGAEDFAASVPGLVGALNVMKTVLTLPLQPLFFLKDRIDDVGRSMKKAEPVVQTKATAMAAHFHNAKDNIGAAATDIVASIDKIPKATNRANTKVVDSLHSIVNSFITTKDALESAAQGAADALYDPIIAKMELAATQRDLIETNASIRSGKLKDKDLADAKLHAAELEKTQIEQLATLAAYGDKSAETTLQNMLDTLKSTKNLSDNQIANIKLLELELDKLRIHAINANNALSGQRSKTNDRGRASGGPVRKGEPYIVGEHRPELFVPDSNGRIEPRVPATALASSDSSGPAWPPITINNPEPRAADEDIARTMRRLAALGIRG